MHVGIQQKAGINGRWCVKLKKGMLMRRDEVFLQQVKHHFRKREKAKSWVVLHAKRKKR